jgi:NaMN:DMB phosphoribosyltransferase
MRLLSGGSDKSSFLYIHVHAIVGIPTQQTESVPHSYTPTVMDGGICLTTVMAATSVDPQRRQAVICASHTWQQLVSSAID